MSEIIPNYINLKQGSVAVIDKLLKIKNKMSKIPTFFWFVGKIEVY